MLILYHFSSIVIVTPLCCFTLLFCYTIGLGEQKLSCVKEEVLEECSDTRMFEVSRPLCELWIARLICTKRKIWSESCPYPQVLHTAFASCVQWECAFNSRSMLLINVLLCLVSLYRCLEFYIPGCLYLNLTLYKSLTHFQGESTN